MCSSVVQILQRNRCSFIQKSIYTVIRSKVTNIALWRCNHLSACIPIYSFWTAGTPAEALLPSNAASRYIALVLWQSNVCGFICFRHGDLSFYLNLAALTDHILYSAKETGLVVKHCSVIGKREKMFFRERGCLTWWSYTQHRWSTVFCLFAFIIYYIINKKT